MLAFGLATDKLTVPCDKVDKLKIRTLENAMTWLGLGNADGFNGRPLRTAEVVIFRRRMCITIRGRPETTASVMDSLKGIRDRDIFWMPVPFKALAFQVLGKTALVWKPDETASGSARAGQMAITINISATRERCLRVS